ncbi:MAG: hypothetical protein M3300_00370, partial [Actinomycetota bacterium]|nr:hypothetical protein [Actinomycetota bacterium]
PMTINLVDSNTGKHFGEYLTEQAALRDVWSAIKRDGEGAVSKMRLEYEDLDGQGRVLAEGDGLAKRARLVNTQRSRLN